VYDSNQPPPEDVEGDGDDPVAEDNEESLEDFAWAAFAVALAEALEVLEPDQYLILNAPRSRFVQVAIQHGEVRVETVSNQYLDEADRLPFDDLDVLATLGWEAPTYFADVDVEPDEGSPNHFLDLPSGMDLANIALLLVATVRLVHEVVWPTELTYAAFDDGTDPGKILLPTLGISRS